MPRVLLLATTTGYQTRSFGEAAERLGVELVFATDRCDKIDDPWRDGAIPIRFYDEDGSVAAILDSAATQSIDGILVVGDRPTVIGARVAQALGLPGHPPEAAAIARHKAMMRTRLRDAGLPVPWFIPLTIDREASTISRPASAPADDAGATSRLAEAPEARRRQPLSYPCVIKPVALSGSRGVMRADDPRSFVEAFERLAALLRSPDVRAERNEAHDRILIESFVPGREYAIEAVLHHGVLRLIAIFDKPDPLDGPFFEETIYLTPSAAPPDVQRAIVRSVAAAADAIGLHHGPIHAECRVHPSTGEVFVLEVAARPIGGLCARVIRFADGTSLEHALLKHAIGESPESWVRESSASGVMMIPIPRRGILRRVEGIDAARAVPGVDDVRITAKTDQTLIPLPEGASYLGFIFARAPAAGAVERVLRDAHARLTFVIDPELQVLSSSQTGYNQRAGQP
jgi:biotin carboxylase